MNKIVLGILIGACWLSACNNAAEEDGTSTGKKAKKISSRNYHINRSNSYSDLFLDSNLVESFISEKKVPDSLAYRIRSFYNSRNYQFAWFTSDGLTEQARGFWNLYNNYLAATDDTTLENKSLKKKMQALVAEDTLYPSARDKNILNTEISLTGQFIHHTLVAYEPDYVKRKEMERFVPSQKLDAIYLADSLLNKKHKDDKYYEDVNPTYGLLKKKLGEYVALHKNGGWPQIPVPKKALKTGYNGPEIITIKKRLKLSGDLPVDDTTQVFNEHLETAVKNFQLRHGLKADGIVSKGTATEMNIPVIARIRQLLINMDRARWLPQQQDGKLILVNIPAFKLHVMEGNQEVFDMDVVVGKEGNNTRVFTGNLNQVVFNPHWNVPKNIVEKEILPAMEEDPEYLEKENMEIVKENEDGLPQIRQKPGEKNALGEVKFLFPNSYDIYFHDTPAKSLFKKDKRAFSHGCIRLSDPVKMANYLLKDQPEWTDQRIAEELSRDEEKFVRVKNPVPVLITYYTAWVDQKGQLNFREDIYDHDREVMDKMFTRS